MSRESNIHIYIPPEQLKQIQQKVSSGDFASLGDAIRAGLRMLLGRSRGTSDNTIPSNRQDTTAIQAAYRATAARDLALTHEWDQLPDQTWPEQ